MEKNTNNEVSIHSEKDVNKPNNKVEEKNKAKKVCLGRFTRHKWIPEYLECLFCGGGMVKTCARCGDETLKNN